jgi:hypothetical protein
MSRASVLEQMLQHEYQLRWSIALAAERGARPASSPSPTRSRPPHPDGKGRGHSWIGLRFQEAPLTPPSEVLLHLRLWDKDAGRQQDALGIVGVNLIHAASMPGPAWTPSSPPSSKAWPAGWRSRFVHFKGPAFGAFDNRSAALRLVRLGLTDAVLFGPEGVPEVPSEYLYKKNLLVARGTFRPVSSSTRTCSPAPCATWGRAGRTSCRSSRCASGRTRTPRRSSSTASASSRRSVGPARHPAPQRYRLPAYFACTPPGASRWSRA